MIKYISLKNKVLNKSFKNNIKKTPKLSLIKFLLIY